MRVIFLTQDDPLYILPFFESFFSEELGDIEVTAMFVCRSMGSRSRMKLLMELLRLYGPVGFTKLLGLQLWQRAASALKIGKVIGTTHSLCDVAEAHGIPYYPIGNPNSGANFTKISEQAPDMIVSVACPYILKSALLKLPTRAAVNIHHAPLPRYKGMMPTFWQMYHGEKSLGITIHTMAEKIDEGDILYQRSVPVEKETMHQLIRRSKREGGTAMVELLQRYARGEQIEPIAVSSEPSYFTFPTAVEMRTFRQRGLRAI